MDKLTINFDALKQSHWSEKELKNAEVITDFVQHLMNNHDFDYILKKYGQNNYVQHNLSISEGIEGLVNYVKGFVKRFPDFMYDVKYILASGDMVVFHSHVTSKAKDRGNENKGFIITDRWKVVDGEILEHWDAIQPINAFMRLYAWLAGGKIKNANRRF